VRSSLSDSISTLLSIVLIAMSLGVFALMLGYAVLLAREWLYARLRGEKLAAEKAESLQEKQQQQEQQSEQQGHQQEPLDQEQNQEQKQDQDGDSKTSSHEELHVSSPQQRQRSASVSSPISIAQSW